MIEYAKPEWIPQLKHIWKECFQDEDSYIDFYFKHRFLPENMLVWTKEGKPVAMLSLLPAKQWKKERENPKNCYYVYAVATDPKYQGKGISSKLCEAVLEKSRKEKAALVLVPGEKSLLDFYKKRGFHIAYERTPLCFSIEKQTERSIKDTIVLSDISPEEYKSRRDSLFGTDNYIEWDTEAVRYALAENKLLGGRSIMISWKNSEGVIYREDILLGYRHKDTFIIRETSLNQEMLGQIGEYLCSRFACRKICMEQIYAMTNCRDWTKQGYFGLALE